MKEILAVAKTEYNDKTSTNTDLDDPHI